MTATDEHWLLVKNLWLPIENGLDALGAAGEDARAKIDSLANRLDSSLIDQLHYLRMERNALFHKDKPLSDHRRWEATALAAQEAIGLAQQSVNVVVPPKEPASVRAGEPAEVSASRPTSVAELVLGDFYFLVPFLGFGRRRFKPTSVIPHLIRAVFACFLILIAYGVVEKALGAYVQSQTLSPVRIGEEIKQATVHPAALAHPSPKDSLRRLNGSSPGTTGSRAMTSEAETAAFSSAGDNNE